MGTQAKKSSEKNRRKKTLSQINEPVLTNLMIIFGLS